MRHSIVVFMVSTAWVSTATLADEPMKPGLWDVSVKMKVDIEMSPEQREMVKKFGMPGLGGNPITIVKKRCMTKAMSERNALQPPGFLAGRP